MKVQCLPFSQIPHTTRLFTDFLYDFPKVRQFYPRPPDFKQWFKDEASLPRYDPARRDRMAGILDRQNRNFGVSRRTLENIARFRAGASVIVTGQQVGLFGGPLFSLFKAVSAVKLAAEASAAGIECVPIFWLATQDHDLEEVNNASLPGPDGALVKITAPSHGVTDAPVSTVKFGPEIEQVVQSALDLLGESEASEWLREAYRPGETLGSAFARLFARLFGEWGVILLDAADPELSAITEPIYRAAIEKASEIDDALLTRGKELEAAGYHQQVKITPSSTLLFTLENGARVLRFCEPEFPQLKPGKSGTGQRMYRRRDVENVLRIRKLLYEDGFTISGARQQIRVEAKATSKVQAPLPFPRRQSSELKRVRQGLREILGMLSARR